MLVSCVGWVLTLVLTSCSGSCTFIRVMTFQFKVCVEFWFHPQVCDGFQIEKKFQCELWLIVHVMKFSKIMLSLNKRKRVIKCQISAICIVTWNAFEIPWFNIWNCQRQKYFLRIWPPTTFIANWKLGIPLAFKFLILVFSGAFFMRVLVCDKNFKKSARFTMLLMTVLGYIRHKMGYIL